MIIQPPVHTKAELIARVEESNKAYVNGELIPAATALAEIREKHALISA